MVREDFPHSSACESAAFGPLRLWLWFLKRLCYTSQCHDATPWLLSVYQLCAYPVRVGPEGSSTRMIRGLELSCYARG